MHWNWRLKRELLARYNLQRPSLSPISPYLAQPPKADTSNRQPMGHAYLRVAISVVQHKITSLLIMLYNFICNFLRLDYTVLCHDFVDDSIRSQWHLREHGLKHSFCLYSLSAVHIDGHYHIEAMMTLREDRRVAPKPSSHFYAKRFHELP